MSESNNTEPQLTREEAIQSERSYASNENHPLRKLDNKERALFQLQQTELCMPLGVFYKSLCAALGRTVTPFELGGGPKKERLIAELNGEVKPPTSEEVQEMVPKGELTDKDRTAFMFVILGLQGDQQ